MDFSEMKVTERQQNAGPCGRFTVREPERKVTVRSGRIESLTAEMLPDLR